MYFRLLHTATAPVMRAIGAGLLLGGMQLLLLLQGPLRLGWRLSLGVGLSFYLLIPLLAALLTVRRTENILRGVLVDWLAGAVASIAFLLPFLLNLLTSAHSPAGAHQTAGAGVPALSFPAVATLLALVFASLGMLLTIAGGACGRAIGKSRRARALRSYQHIPPG